VVDCLVITTTIQTTKLDKYLFAEYVFYDNLYIIFLVLPLQRLTTSTIFTILGESTNSLQQNFDLLLDYFSFLICLYARRISQRIILNLFYVVKTKHEVNLFGLLIAS